LADPAPIQDRMLNAALWYADLGYPVFPCTPGRKKPPLTEHGLLDATTDSEQIERWWTQHPSANVAIRTDGLLVVDIDGADNPWLADDPDRLEELANAPTSLTPRGGRQHVFRQPEGKHWRNSASQLALHVDIRADGGYIVAPPSVTNGGAYRWLEDHELEVPADRLPQPPAWLIELLDALPTSNGHPTVRDGPQFNTIPEGQRNDTLARLAGTMRRVGMTQAEIAAALHQVNAGRCAPPLDTREVDRIAASVARYEPDQIATAVAEGHWQHMVQAEPVQPLSVRDIVAKYPALREPVICGLLRRGETMNVISVPKLGKSWLVIDLALAIASGRMWLESFQTERGDVLILDNELHGETSANRIPKVAATRGIPTDAFADRVFVLNLRGQLKDVFSLRPFFESIEPGRYRVIILDAFYRFMPRDMDENDNGTMASLYNHLDLYADRLGCCFVLIHHTTKGNQSAKSVTDVGAGAGSQSRATDTHLILRPHEETDAVVLDAAVRSWPPVPARCLRWTFPVWSLADELDPSALRGGKPTRRKEEKKSDDPQAPEWTVERFVEVFIADEPTSKAEIRDAAKGEPGLSWRRVADLLEIAESQGLIRCERSGRGGRMLYSTAPEEEPSP